MAKAIQIPAIPQVPTVAELDTQGGKELLIDWMLAVQEIVELREAQRGIEPAERAVIRRELDGYESEEMTITNGGLLSVRHELFLGAGVEAVASVPRHVQAVLVNQAPDAGYEPGDRVQVGVNVGGGMSARSDTEKIHLRLSDLGLSVNNKNTGVSQAIINSKWRLVVRAWA